MATDSSTPPAKCLKCQGRLESPIVCAGCQTLYPPPQTADYFDLLGLPRKYAIDEQQLASAFRAITRYIHPDKHAVQTDEVRALSTRLSAEVNRAASVLRDPVQRAAYMLELCGGPSAVEVRDVPPSFLAEVMELRERIDEARAADNATSMTELRGEIEARRADTMKQIIERADSLAAAYDDERKSYRKLLNSIRYFDNLLAELVADPLAQSTGTGHD
jgi:molecular chaperone HscB